MKRPNPLQLALPGTVFAPAVVDPPAPKASPPPEGRRAGPAWSHSRRSTLEQCSRKYYYTYYGASARSAKGEPDKDELRLLKGLANRHERAGSLLHLGIGTYFRRAQRGERVDADGLVAWARTIFLNDRAYSRAHPGGGVPPGTKYPPTLLREYHYAQPDADALCDEADGRLAVALRAFATDERYAEFRAAGSAPGALVEKRLTISGLPCAASGQLDLAYAREGRVTIVDWKTGAGDGSGDDSLQLAVYALWAVEHFGCRPADLRVCKAHLTTGKVVEFRADDGVLADARARIAQDAERMVAVDRYGRDGVAAAFTPSPRPALCALCAYQRVCPEGRKLLNA